MKTIFRFALAMGLLALPAAAFSSPPPDNDNADAARLIRLEHDWLAAARGGNRKVLARILDDRFLDTSWRGRLRDKAAMLAVAARAPDGTAARLSDLKAHLFGTTGIVTGLNTISGPDHTWTARIRFTDIFHKQDGRWRAIGAQETLLQPARGGRKQPPG